MSELEGAVLGVVSLHDRLTPYQIRKVFERSPNPHWSGSAGSIYPLVQRLARNRLLSVREHATGERRGLKYNLTASGRKILRAWIIEAEHEKLVGISDLLRLRFRFLPALTSKEQRRFVDTMISKMSAEVKKIEADNRKQLSSGDVYSYLTARGALLMARARLAWLREVMARIFSQGADKRPVKTGA
ncbi:MAG TPA: PadR family transcriptional regulator [Chthoniobacterales bacterium]|nr:PadR family transcriptional regulator [Chthoniobacterales bacterium]